MKMLTNFLIANQEKVLERTVLFDKIYDCIDSKNDWSIIEFILLYGMTSDFKPDCILELGRGKGNSLYTISLSIDDLEYSPKSVISISLEKECVIRRINAAVGRDTSYKLNQSITIRAKDFLKWDYSILQQRDNILIFYDIHGAKPMQHFIAKIIPLLQQKRHMVIFHDFSYEPTLTKEKFYQRKKAKPSEFPADYFVAWNNRQGGGITGFEEVPVLIEYIKQAGAKIGFPYRDLSVCLEQYYRGALEKLSNYRKGFFTSLITVNF